MLEAKILPGQMSLGNVPSPPPHMKSTLDLDNFFVCLFALWKSKFKITNYSLVASHNLYFGLFISYLSPLPCPQCQKAILDVSEIHLERLTNNFYKDTLNSAYLTDLFESLLTFGMVSLYPEHETELL